MKRQGYTPGELLIVLAGTGMLAALLIPVLAQNSQNAASMRDRENARRAQCQNRLKQLAIGIAQYTQDYDDLLPFAVANHSDGAFGGKDKIYSGWVELVEPYIKIIVDDSEREQIFQCPTDKRVQGNNPMRGGYTDYWLNRNVASRDLTAVRRPAQTLLLGDGDGGSAASNARYALTSLPRAWLTSPNSPARRHLDGANYAFVDGHVKWLKPQGITTNKVSAATSTGGTFSIK